MPIREADGFRSERNSKVPVHVAASICPDSRVPAALFPRTPDVPVPVMSVRPGELPVNVNHNIRFLDSGAGIIVGKDSPCSGGCDERFLLSKKAKGNAKGFFRCGTQKGLSIQRADERSANRGYGKRKEVKAS